MFIPRTQNREVILFFTSYTLSGLSRHCKILLLQQKDRHETKIQRSVTWHNTGSNSYQPGRSFRMGGFGTTHPGQLFPQQSQHPVEPDFFAQNTLGKKKGGRTVHQEDHWIIARREEAATKDTVRCNSFRYLRCSVTIPDDI